MGSLILDEDVVGNSENGSKPNCAVIARQIEVLGSSDDWPVDEFFRPDTVDSEIFLMGLSDEKFFEFRDWLRAALVELDVSRTSGVWDRALPEFIEWLKTGEPAPQGNEFISDFEVIEKAVSILTCVVPWSAGSLTPSVTSAWPDEVRTAVIDWAEDVVATHEAGGSLRDNGGTLLNVPEPLRELFDWEQAEAAAVGAETAKPESGLGDECDDDDDDESAKPETAFEAKVRIEEMIPTALRQLRDAESIAESRKKAHDVARKNVESMQDQLNTLVEELSEALTGITGGDYQLRFPLDRVSGDAKTGITPDPAAKSGSQEKTDLQASPVPAPNVGLVAADPIAGESVAVLVADQLSAKTNGKSDGAGIPQGTVDLLVDASLGTIGLLEEHMRKRGDFWAKDIKGVGPGKSEKIVAAMGVLRQCYPQPATVTDPLEELILDQVAYEQGRNAKLSGGPRICGYSVTGHQGRSWLKGYDNE